MGTINFLDLVYEAIDEINEQLPPEQTISKDPQTRLWGELDSLTIVNLVVAVEQRVDAQTGRTVSLTDESIMTEEANVLTTVESLKNFLNQQL